jgi:D-alanyl-lipoteichoic acid acyltransferase DltB (MBOAT superfamily)
MLFNSISFLIFFPVVILINFILPKKVRNLWLLFASYYFYMSWNVKYGLLIALSTVITYVSSLLIEGCAAGWKRKTAFVFCICSNLGILFFFKYFTWILGNINQITHHTYELPFTILLPVGISFYTFQALGYTIDVYQGKLKAERNFINYALFVSFFPQLVAGPIERSTNLLKQFRQQEDFNPDHVTRGLQIMLWGFFEKMVIADNLALLVDQVYQNWQDYSGSILLLATVLFTIQIYCDFGGYSHIAIGAAKVLNVDLMDNFHQPLFANRIQDLWRRWHISMSTWFKDYVYIPLGGSRCSRFRKNCNIMITFLISGLWHGASWHYVVWGGLHGAYQVISSYLEPVQKGFCHALRLDYRGKCYRTLQQVVTFFLFVFSLIFFRASGVSEALQIFRQIGTNFAAGDLISGQLLQIGLSSAQWLLVLPAILLLFAVDACHEKGIRLNEQLQKRPLAIRWGAYYFLILYLLLSILQTFGRSAATFLYFQF